MRSGVTENLYDSQRTGGRIPKADPRASTLDIWRPSRRRWPVSQELANGLYYFAGPVFLGTMTTTVDDYHLRISYGLMKAHSVL